MENQMKISSPGIHIMAKPAGPNCNLNCQYCYYLEKDILFSEKKTRMSDEILETFVKKYISSQPTPVVEFVWQGGEPTLMGIDFYEKAVRYQNKFNNGKQIINVIQTNGVKLDDAWCKFLKKNNFLVGLSLDGPEDIHNLYRTSPGGQPVFESVYKGLKNLQKYNVEFNLMASVAKETSKRPLDVYNFFKSEDVKFMQFLPIVERLPSKDAEERGFHLSPPADLQGEDNNRVTSWSVEPEAYGDFLIDICETWVRNDVGKIFVMNFDWALSAWIGNPSPVCRFAKQCGRSIVMEHNGDVFACDPVSYTHLRAHET